MPDNEKILGASGIETCDSSYNPVWGCNNACLYCYAKPIAKRFAGPMALTEMQLQANEHTPQGFCREHERHQRLEAELSAFNLPKVVCRACE